MDLIRCIQKIRPGFTLKDNHVNPFSLDTIALTLEHPEGVPTIAECEAAWEEITKEMEKTSTIEKAFDSFQEKVKEGFDYKGHMFRCNKDDLLMWAEGVLVMEDQNMETTNAIDISNGVLEVTPLELKEIRNKARATFFIHWNEYQNVKNK